MSLDGLIDAAAEVKRLEKQLAEKRKALEVTQKKLANADFVARAPKDVIDQQRASVAELEQQIRVLEETLADLRG